MNPNKVSSPDEKFLDDQVNLLHVHGQDHVTVNVVSPEHKVDKVASIDVENDLTESLIDGKKSDVNQQFQIDNNELPPLQRKTSFEVDNHF